MQGNVDQRTVVDDTCRVCHLLAPAEGGLTDGDLPLVGVADDIPRLRCLGNLAQRLVGVPLDNLAHLTGLMGSGRIVVEGHEGTVGVGIVGDEHGAVGAGFLANDEISACHCCRRGGNEHGG